jgi:hypothetical protein
MPGLEAQVFIFDQARTDRYRELAVKTVQAVGFSPVVFDKVGLADRTLVEEGDNVRALISGLGARNTTGFSYEVPALPLLREAARRKIPIALLSGRPDAGKLINSATGDILLPLHPYEEIAPTLHKWLGNLMAEPARVQA